MYNLTVGRRASALPLKLVVALGLVALLVAQPLMAATPALAAGGGIRLASLPLSFVPNVGQLDSQVAFQVRDGVGTVFFTPEAVVLALPSAAVHLRFDGANPATIDAVDRLPGSVSYYVGADPDGWQAGIPTYGGIVYEGVYPGVDLAYDGSSGQLKSTYTVAAGADPGLIRWHHEGAESVQIDEASGDLLVELAGSTLVEQAPVAWQVVDGERVPVSVGYTLGTDGSVGFELGSFDETLPLTIDPVLSYSTFLGGTGFDEADGLALDGDGNIYVAGSTTSVDFPGADPATYEGHEDAFVAKLNPAGDTLLYSVYVGGSCDDDPNGIGVDAAGNAYIAGDTDSGGKDCKKEFPTLNAHQDKYGGGDYDAFAAKLDGDGNLVYSTYLGGNSRDDADAIAVDPAGNAYIVGSTTSDDDWVAGGFNGVMDAYAIKLDPDGAWAYGWYMGGSDGDSAWAVEVAGDEAVVVGDTASADFPTTAGAYQDTYAGEGDMFVARLTDDGSGFIFSTYLGGSGKDYSYGVALDAGGYPYVTGQTESADFPTTAGAYDTVCGTDGQCNPGYDEWDLFGEFYTYGDVIVTKLNDDGGSLEYSTFVGGRSLDKAYAIAVDEKGHAYVTGDTFSADFPTRYTIHDFRGVPGEPDVFVIKLRAQGDDLYYGTFLGGHQADFGTGIALIDKAAWVVGVTLSEDFPVTDDALQDTHAGGIADSFLARLDPTIIGGATVPSHLLTMAVSWTGLLVALVLLGAGVVALRKRSH